MKTTFVFIILLLCSRLFAQECEPVNLVSASKSSFQKIPVYDQNGSNTCYAFVSAGLVNFEAMKKGAPDLQAHPTWMALISPDMSTPGTLTAGTPSNTIRKLAKELNCPTEVVEKSLQDWSVKSNLTSSQIMGILDSTTVKMKSLPNPKNADASQILNQITCGVKGVDCNGDLQIFDIKKYGDLEVFTSKEVLRKVVLTECQEKKSALNLSEIQVGFLSKNKNEFSSSINTILDTKANPIAISYCAEALYTPGYEGISTSADGTRRQNKCGQHVSLIVGKKMVADQCHYLLRNSWGSGFGGWTKKFKCFCKNKTTGAFLDDCTESAHNNGDFSVEGCWIPQTTIDNNVFESTYFN